VTPEQRELSAMLFLLFLVCAVFVACIVDYLVDVRCAEERKRKFEEDLQRMDAENRVRREQRLQAERLQRQQMAQEARDLSERNLVALHHMIAQREAAK